MDKPQRALLLKGMIDLRDLLKKTPNVEGVHIDLKHNHFTIVMNSPREVFQLGREISYQAIQDDVIYVYAYVDGIEYQAITTMNVYSELFREFAL